MRIRPKPAIQRGAVASVRSRLTGSRAFSGGSEERAPFSRTNPALKTSVVAMDSTTPKIMAGPSLAPPVRTRAWRRSRAPRLDEQDARGRGPPAQQQVQRPQHAGHVMVGRAVHTLTDEAPRGEELRQRPLGEHPQVAG